MWDIKPFYKAPSPATGAKKPHKDQSRTRQIGKSFGIVKKEAAKQKIHNNNKTGFCLRKSKITRIWRSFFEDPRFFSGQKMFEPSALLSVVSASPTTFTFPLIPLIGATWPHQVFAMLGQFSRCFRMILQPNP